MEKARARYLLLRKGDFSARGGLIDPVQLRHRVTALVRHLFRKAPNWRSASKRISAARLTVRQERIACVSPFRQVRPGLFPKSRSSVFCLSQIRG